MKKTRVAILISGRGSNMKALIKASGAADYPAEIALVVSNVPDAGGLAVAQASGIATMTIDHKAFGKGADGKGQMAIRINQRNERNFQTTLGTARAAVEKVLKSVSPLAALRDERSILPDKKRLR